MAQLEKGLNHLKSLVGSDITGSWEMFIKDRLKEFYLDLDELGRALKNQDVNEIKNIKFRRLFKGTCSVGNMYFVGSKTQ